MQDIVIHMAFMKITSKTLLRIVILCIIVFSATLLTQSFSFANCTGGERDEYKEFPQFNGVQIYACIHGAHEEKIGEHQDVSWGVRNLTGDKLEIHFTKVYHFKNGMTIRRNIDFGGFGITLKPYEFKSGGNFFGDDITLNDNFFKEDCACSGEAKRVIKIGFEDFRVENISKAEKEEAEKRP